MRCPQCDAALGEVGAKCSACGFSLGQASRHFGTPVPLHPHLTDPDYVLKGGQLDEARRAILGFESQFPQCGLTVAFLPVEREVRLPVYACWLFNKAGICRDAEKGGHNGRVFLLFDTSHRRATITVGYGLEPFLSTERLRACLDPGAAALERGDFRESCSAIVAALEHELHELAGQAATCFGLPAAAGRSQG